MMKIWKALAATAAITVMAGGAHASVTYGLDRTESGNACAGVLGTPPDCFLDGSPLIVKFNADGTVDELGRFASIDGSEFSFTETSEGVGTWTYTPDDPTDPGITGYAVKGGPNFNVYKASGPVFAGQAASGSFSTPTNPGGNTPALSNLSFYDSIAAIPVPAALPLLAFGLGALGFAARRQRKARAA